MDYYNTYDYSYSNSAVDSILTGIVAIYLIILVVWLLFYVISYIFKGIGMYTIAKRQGRENPWLAFIPFARTYLHGELAGDMRLKNKSIKNPGIWLLIMPFIFGAVNFVFYLIIWFLGVGVASSALSASMYGYDYGYSSPGLTTGSIMGLIIVMVIWMVVAVVYGAAYKVLKALVNHQILEKFTSKNMSVAHAVLCLVVPLYESICLFAMRNKPYNPGMEPNLGRPFMQAPPPVVPPQGGPGPGPYMAAGMQEGPTPKEAPHSAPDAKPWDAPKEAPEAKPWDAPHAAPEAEASDKEERGDISGGTEQNVIYVEPTMDHVEETSQEAQTYDEYVKKNEDSEQ